MVFPKINQEVRGAIPIQTDMNGVVNITSIDHTSNYSLGRSRHGNVFFSLYQRIRAKNILLEAVDRLD